jgi:hypothetical protein
MRALLTGLLACGFFACVATGALANTAPPCSRGCDVPVGTYEGKNDQGDHVTLHVAVGHLKSGPHIVATVHIIDRFKTRFVVTCGGTRANNYIDSTHWGHIEGVQGHWRYGEDAMHTLWAPGGPIVGDAEVKSPSCTGITHFTLQHTSHH